jgi:hypothetical protein
MVGANILRRRYSVNMRQLTKFETDANRPWFRDSQKYWYEAVFGTFDKTESKPDSV